MCALGASGQALRTPGSLAEPAGMTGIAIWDARCSNSANGRWELHFELHDWAFYDASVCARAVAPRQGISTRTLFPKTEASALA
jgi:hypothetical protein